VVEHFLGKEGVTGSIPVMGSGCEFLSVDVNVKNARHYSNAMWRMQAPELQHDEKQKKYAGQTGTQKVLSLVPASYPS
jgi:hypothetical protein